VPNLGFLLKMSKDSNTVLAEQYLVWCCYNKATLTYDYFRNLLTQKVV
jgi:hypothetical protein